MSETDESGDEEFPEPDEYFGSDRHLERVKEACEDARPHQTMRFTGWSNTIYHFTPEEILALVNELLEHKQQDQDDGG